ncbi:MAG: hypothetical protein QOF60_364 [Actinomycetota bacterium]|jgi:hypothetical protein|nr:hypothetical protein [Actinomycetota bacterium]
MRLRKGPASAGSFRVGLVAALVPLLLSSACANPFGRETPATSPEPLPGLGQRPAGSPSAVAGDGSGDSGPATTAAGSATPPASTARPVGATAPGATAPTSPAGPGGPGPSPPTTIAARTAARAEDAAGDAGVGDPAYADARLFAVEDLGARARVTVRVGGALPAKLASEEVVGIGVDFYRTNGTESEYQLFADGGSDGWRAYLQTPAGFVDYPGDFHLGGDTLQFEVAWSDLGGAPTGSVRAFVDWAKPTVAGVIQRTQDLAPDRDRAPLN